MTTQSFAIDLSRCQNLDPLDGGVTIVDVYGDVTYDVLGEVSRPIYGAPSAGGSGDLNSTGPRLGQCKDTNPLAKHNRPGGSCSS